MGNKEGKAVVKMSYADYYDQESARLVSLAESSGKEVSETSLRKKVAKEYLKLFVSIPENLELIPEIKEPLEITFKAIRTASSLSPRGVVRDAVTKLLTEAVDPVGEDDVFNTSLQHGSAWGRAEMKRFIRDCVNTEPDKRIWIEFVPATGSDYIGAYRVVATGRDVPEGWTGYRPSDDDSIDL